MPELELHDLTNDQTFAVPAEGLVFGREGGDADVQLADNTISRRQARISFKGGNWLYETMSVPQGKPMPRPRPLAQGETFRIGRTEFEVLNVGEEEQEQEQDQPTPAVARGPAKKGGGKASSAQAKTMAGQALPAEGGDEEPAAKGFGAMFVAVPKGLAYYLVNVPKMLFNPFGTVATAIEELPAEPMGKIELIGYALPAQLATALLGAWAGGLAALIGPAHHFELMSFLPVVPAVIAVAVAIGTGFLFHLVLEWVLRKVFKGSSDSRNRTNYFLQTMTLSVLLAVPSALGTLVAALPVPFIGLLGPLLATLASLVTIYVNYQWFSKVFNVAKWARTLLLVIGALLVLLAAKGFVMGLIDNIRSLGSHSTSVGSTGNADADAAIAEAQKQAKELQDQAEAAQEKGGDAAAKAHKMAEELRKKAEAEAAGAEGGAKAPPDVKPIDDKKVEAKAEKAPEKKAEPKAEPKAEAQPEPRAEPRPEPKAEPKAEPAPAAEAGGAYATFARKRERMEKLLENDPLRLDGNKDLQELYSNYLEDSAKVEKKYKKDITNHPDRARLYEHLRDAELYKKTGAEVDELAKKLGIR